MAKQQTKRESLRTQGLTVAGLILIIVILSILGFIIYSYVSEPEMPSQPQPEIEQQIQQSITEQLEERLRKEGIKLGISVSITEKRVIRVEAATNFPDGTTLMFKADNPEIFGRAENTVAVKNGIAISELYTQGAKAGTYEVEVVFTPWHNAKVITDIVGKQGEQIKEIGVSEGTISEPAPTGLQITIIKNSTFITIE